MLITKSGFPEKISDSRLEDCVDTPLSMQNKDWGLVRYENARRGFNRLKLINPAEIFDRIMVEYSYRKCTYHLGSLFLDRCIVTNSPSYRTAEITRAMLQAKTFIEGSQENDGSWYGSWATCFTYGTFFALHTTCDHWANISHQCQSHTKKRLWMSSKQGDARRRVGRIIIIVHARLKNTSCGRKAKSSILLGCS